MDKDFTRKNAQGSREDAQAEITPDQICGTLPKEFNSKAYATRPWKITATVHDGDRFDLGARTLELIATPGHPPDAISLIDRANGLLFTGDTYYPAPIWLFRPETDLRAYAASIRRLAALAPQVKVVLGAHNIPVAPPSVLTRLVTAFDAVRAGKTSATPAAAGRVISGDTYYPAPIWLYRPETDLEAYAASIRRLAALAPQVKHASGLNVNRYQG